MNPVPPPASKYVNEGHKHYSSVYTPIRICLADMRGEIGIFAESEGFVCII